jgi:hypothetical protein
MTESHHEAKRIVLLLRSLAQGPFFVFGVESAGKQLFFSLSGASVFYSNFFLKPKRVC